MIKEFLLKRMLKKNKDVEAIKFTRFTEEAWDKYRPGRKMEEYYDTMQPNSVVDFALSSYAQMLLLMRANTKKLMICMIDDEYGAWLEEKGLEDDDQNMMDYIGEMDEETAFRLLQKNHMDVQYTACMLGITVKLKDEEVPAKTEFVLSTEDRETLKAYLEKVYGEGSIYVPGYILTSDAAENAEDDLVTMAINFFDHGVNTRFGKWDEQIYEMTKTEEKRSLRQYFVPFVVRGTIKVPYVSSEVPLEEADFALYPYIVTFTQDIFEHMQIKAPLISDSDAGKMLEETFKEIGEITLDPVIVRPAVAPDMRAKITGGY